MAKTYTWHSGADALSPQWVLPVPLLPDELFSGWLARAALRQGCSLYTLIKYLWPGMMLHDVDRGMTRQQLTSLSNVSGVPPEAFGKSMLFEIAHRIDGKDHRRQSIWSWILPQGLRTSNRPLGAQYCPTCWQEDEKPFIRLPWRLAWHTACAKHRTMLIDRCFQCKSAIRTQYLRPTDGCLSRCAICKADLKSAITHEADQHGLDFQNIADTVLLQRKGSAWGHSLESSIWFQVVALLGSYLRREARRNLPRIVSNLQMLNISIDTNLLGFDACRLELLCVIERCRLFALIHRALSLNNDEIMAVKSNPQLCKRQWIARPYRLTPELKALWESVANRPTQPQNRKSSFAPRSRRSVNMMMANLMKRLRDRQ